MMEASIIFQGLRGKWSLIRSITGSITASFIGEASFAPIEDDLSFLLYREQGTMKVDGQNLTAHKEYYYFLDNDKILVFLDKEKQALFHEIQLSGNDAGEGQGKHLCKADEYLTHYFFTDPFCFTTVCIVKGPKKNYKICSDYQKEKNG